MVKPCNYRILTARAVQLIKWSQSATTQEDMQETTTAAGLPQPEQAIITSQADKRFLERVNTIVAQHISDPDFTIDQMAEMMRMGRTKLYGKVKELTGMSPNKLFVSERMRIAAKLIEEDELNISEIGYRVGIQDAAYFNKCFKQYFGMAPSKYRKK
jgi:AraC-like DNA-binding protein